MVNWKRKVNFHMKKPSRAVVLLVVLLTIFNLSSAQDIEKLLKEYEESAKLYKRTARESLGHLFLFTRKDLERYQIHTLRDLLKSLPLLTTGYNRFGVLTLNAFGYLSGIPRFIRLYINEHEVSSIHTGSPFLVWEYFPLDIAEHVEVYLGVGAIELGNDPGLVIIKVYTKEAFRENASKVRASGSSRRGYDGVFYIAKELNDGYSVLFLLSLGRDERANYRQNLRRDVDYKYAFVSVSKEGITFDVGYGFTSRDPFMHFSSTNNTYSSHIDTRDYYISLTARPDRDTKFLISFDNHKRNFRFEDPRYLFIPVFMDPQDPQSFPVVFYENALYHKVEAYASRTLRTDKNSLLLALSYKVYASDTDERYYETVGGQRVEKKTLFPFTRQEILSFIAEDSYSIDPRNRLILGARYDVVNRNGGISDLREWILRAGYITLPTDSIMVKGFLARSYLLPYFYDTDFSGRDLKAIEYPVAVSLEGLYSKEDFSARVGAFYTIIKNRLIPDRGGLLYNEPSKYYMKSVLFEIKKTFSELLSAELGFSTLIEPEDELSPTKGGHLKLSGSWKGWRYFAELIYRNSYRFRDKRERDSYDLSAGISYTFKNGVSVRLKGVNLLNKAYKVPYYNIAEGRVETYPYVDRTLYLTVDWVF